VHGSALRLLAATAEPKRRLALLKQATEQLQASGTRLALAHALGDLGQAYHLLGQSTRARMIVRRAYQLARQCDAEPLCQALLPVTERPSQRPSQRPGSAERDQPAAGQLAQALSDAERRVAELAANGHTNREIAQKLFISISTVEQHMTRILRKLNVSRRSDLPAGLGATAARE
jgi:DNA-binding CsgD family transcriptional regulator